MKSVHIDIPNTKRAIPLYGIANFNLPTIKTAIEDGQLRSGSLVHMLYSHEIFKLSRVSVCDCASDFRCNFKTRSRFWRLPEWITTFQLRYFVSSNFYWPHILKGKAGEMHLQNHLLKKENVLVVFPTGFDMKHDSESDKTASPHWVVVVSPLKYTMNLLFTPANQQRSWSRKGMDRRVEVRRS